jgi:hypothetical protein
VATKTWAGGSSTDWTDPANWTPGIPATGDDVVIPAAARQPILDIGTPSQQSLTLGGGASLSVAGGALDVSGDVSLASGAVLGGSGSLNVAGGYQAGIGGPGAITASDGTLIVAGTIDAGIALSIDATAASDLKIDGSAVAASAIAISDANQTLEIGAHGTLLIGTPESITNGTIRLDAGSTLQDDSGIALGSGSTLIGAGVVISGKNGSGGLLAGTGTVEASGGTLDLRRDIGSLSALTFDIADDPTAILQLDGAVGADNTFTFMAASGQLAFNEDKNATGVTETVVGLNVGADNSAPTNLIDFKAHSVSISGGNVFTGGSGTVELSDGSVLTLSGVTGDSGGTWFANAKPDAGGTGTEIFLSAALTAGGSVTTTASDTIAGATDGLRISGGLGRWSMPAPSPAAPEAGSF